MKENDLYSEMKESKVIDEDNISASKVCIGVWSNE